MNRLLLGVLLLVFCVVSECRVRVLKTSAECSNHGYLFKGQCFCHSQHRGERCEQNQRVSKFYSNDKCAHLSQRLDHLNNISPEHYENDDPEFPRLTGDSIGKGEAAYGDKGNTWVRMHEVSKNFQIFGNNIRARDINQGSLGNCYLLSALASMANILNGKPIRDVFITQKDNSKHVYVTRWLIDGKPRFVSVDEWIPGTKRRYGARPSFSQIAGDSDFWGIILEKAWAKIHGEYMITEAGWQTKVWQALTGAVAQDIHHSKIGVDELYGKIDEMLRRYFPVGCATVINKRKELVQGHAYSVLNCYEVTLDNGRKQKLMKVFNPWNKETWKSNPWADSSSRWTDRVKRQVDYTDANDGVFYLTPTDFHENFGITNWAEYYQDYEVHYKQVAFKSGSENKYDIRFNYHGRYRPIYVYVDEVNKRLRKDCKEPFKAKSMKVSGTHSYDAVHYWTPTVKMTPAAQPGDYSISVRVQKNANYLNSFPVTIYAPKDSITFN